MKLDNFKELLLRKSIDNQNLQHLIKYIKDDFLLDHVVESLEKMASQKQVNHAIRHFGKKATHDNEGAMIHDQLSHHASKYKSALKSGDTVTADKHMKKIHQTMHMLQKLTGDGKENHTEKDSTNYTDDHKNHITYDAVNPMPWEENFKDGTTSDTYGWKIGNSRNNYDHMRQAPHPGRGDAEKKDGSVKKYKKNRYLGKIQGHGHNKSYPLEEIQVNGKHIHIDDIEHENGVFEEHPFDDHPIIQSGTTSHGAHTPEKHREYLDKVDKWNNDEDGGASKFYDIVDARGEDDHDARGSAKSDPVHHHLHDDNFKALDLNGDYNSPVTPVDPAAAPVKDDLSIDKNKWADSPYNKNSPNFKGNK